MEKDSVKLLIQNLHLHKIWIKPQWYCEETWENYFIMLNFLRWNWNGTICSNKLSKEIKKRVDTKQPKWLILDLDFHNKKWTESVGQCCTKIDTKTQSLKIWVKQLFDGWKLWRVWKMWRRKNQRMMAISLKQSQLL